VRISVSVLSAGIGGVLVRGWVYELDGDEKEVLGRWIYVVICGARRETRTDGRYALGWKYVGWAVVGGVVIVRICQRVHVKLESKSDCIVVSNVATYRRRP
jgi:hypothetical protein